MLGYPQGILDALEFIDDQFYVFADTEERMWLNWSRTNLPRTEAEWLIVFPEARKIISQKILEWRVKERRLTVVARAKLLHVKNSPVSNIEKVIAKEWIRLNEVRAIAVARTHTRRLRYATSSRRKKNGLSQADVEVARAVPIQYLLSDREFRRSGGQLKTLCPLHNERTPSFVVYPNTNSFYCYGCLKGGDAITLVRLLYGCGFVEAVQRLIHRFSENKGRET